MKHTPRPWTVDRTGDYYKKCIRRNGVIVCYLPHNVNNDSLLEAAPDMLEELQLSLGILYGLMPIKNEDVQRIVEYRTATISKLIRRAKGE